MNEKEDLRQRAERMAQEATPQDPEHLVVLSPEANQRLLHELRVHQIELEMQNEELRRAQAELDAARARYFDLYELAPVGYCTLSKEGLLLEANLTVTTLLGMARSAMVKQPLSRFIHPEDLDLFYLHRQRLLEAGDPLAWDMRMVRKDGTAFWGHLEAGVVQDAKGEEVIRLVLSDVTERVWTARAQAFLAKAEWLSNGEGFFPSLARFLAEDLGMDYVCIDRLVGDCLEAETLAIWCDGHFEDNVSYTLKDTPCGDVVGKAICCFPSGVRHLFPKDQVLQDLTAESYLGVTLWGADRQPIGLIALIGRHPIVDTDLAKTTLDLVSLRAATELEHHQAAKERLASQQLLATAFAISPDAFAISRLEDGVYLEVNEGFCKILGYTPSEVVGRSSVAKLNPLWADPKERERLVAILKERGEVIDFEATFLGKNGRSFTGLMSTKTFEMNGVMHLLSNTRDISERKQAEVALTQSEARHSSMVANISDVIGIIGIDGTMKYKSPNIQKWFGWEPQDLIGTDGWLTVHPDDLERIQQEFQTILEWDHATAEVEYRYKCKNGSYKDIGLTATNLMNDPAIAGVLLNYHDITERKQAEEGRRDAEWKFRALFEKGPIGVAYHRMIYDASGKPVDYYFIDANQKYIDLTGVDPRDKRVTEAFPGIENDTGFDWIGTFGHVAKSGELIRFETYLQANKRWYDCVGYQYKPDHFVAAFLEITERKQAEEALRAKTEELSNYFNSSLDLLCIADMSGHFLRLNPEWELTLGYAVAELEGCRFLDFVHPEDLATTLEAMSLLEHQQEVISFENRYRSKDGSYRWIEWRSKPLGDMIYAAARDITERKRLEAERQSLQAQLQQSQKMESLGTLAGGVAHDMNNVLGAILGLASAHIGTQPYGSPLHQALDTICKATERGGKMVKSLLSFARQSPAESNKLDMNAILREQVSLLERTTLAKIRLQMDLETELRPILGDASALTHAFMNLCVNAVDAMAENGTLTLHTRNVDNDWIEVVVEDNGAGMPKEVLEKAMEPFFTTKETGKGTGLGLSMVFSTVKAHRGQMAIESESGKGTRVMLRFPACEQEAPVQVAEPAVANATLPPQGSLKVLVVDDDDLIQSSIQAILEVLGHTAVTRAPSGEEALAILEAGFEPDLVILDMNMPGLGGIGTLPRLRGLRPAVPVLLATGRVDQTALTLASAHPGVTLLSKPFGLRELQKHLESIGLG